MVNSLKDLAMKTANKVFGSAPAAGLLSHPKLQDVVRRVINLRGDVRDALDERVATIARRFDLVTQKELKHFKRMVRELENQIASLEHELAQQRRRADRAEGELDQAKKDAAAAAKPEPKAKAAPKTAPEPKVEAAPKTEPEPKAKAAPESDPPPAKAAEATQDESTAATAAAKKPARTRAPAKKAKKAAKSE